MPLQRARADNLQRTDQVDFLRTNDLGFANLELALKFFLTAGTSGLVTPGTCTPGAGLTVTIGAPLAALTPNGHLAILEANAALNLATAHATLPRIDLVSIGYAEANTDQEERQFINTTTQVAFPDDVDTKVTSSPVLTVTQGTPNASPVAPATPANHVALFEVTVPATATSLVQGNIARVESSFSGPRIYLSTYTPSGDPQYLSPNLRITIPSGRRALLFAFTLLNMNASAGATYNQDIRRDGQPLTINGNGFFQKPVDLPLTHSFFSFGIETLTGVADFNVRIAISGDATEIISTPSCLAALVL